ncbi:unnamed protein product [Psylliodes chrysocephalus]|uniref:Complex I assembly factor TIMMDC1, mitochondrial n=1 Tax=Psylliodes chrysocephalus TaxID=3402493 RepID=A0A9P0GKU5_9CUCU|nr:unnamed protein product [Psylliodes chrysocephala]
MFSTLRNSTRYCLLPFSIANIFSADKLDNLTETEKKSDRTSLKNETGWDRLKKMFEVNEFGNLTNEVNSILQVACMSIFVGALYGGVINSRAAYLEFMRSNEATSFANHLEAKKKLQEAVTNSFAKGAFKWGWRIALFSTSFVAISTMIQTYKGEYGISEYVVAGGLTGTMYKFNMGPRGWVVGGGLGSVLGLGCGAATLGLLKLAGISMQEARYWQNHWQDNRTKYFRKGMAEYIEKENFAVIKIHDEEIGEKGKDIANLVDDSKKEVEKSK